MKTAPASVISDSEPESGPDILNRIRKMSDVFRKLSLNALKNWHQKSGANRLVSIKCENMQGLAAIATAALGRCFEGLRGGTYSIFRADAQEFVAAAAAHAAGRWSAAPRGGQAFPKRIASVVRSFRDREAAASTGRLDRRWGDPEPARTEYGAARGDAVFGELAMANPKARVCARCLAGFLFGRAKPQRRTGPAPAGEV